MAITSDGKVISSSLVAFLTLYSHFSDALVRAATGVTHHNGISYTTTAETLAGVMPVGSNGVNHGKHAYTHLYSQFHCRCISNPCTHVEQSQISRLMEMPYF